VLISRFSKDLNAPFSATLVAVYHKLPKAGVSGMPFTPMEKDRLEKWYFSLLLADINHYEFSDPGRR
jgi:hypothetical protein